MQVIELLSAAKIFAKPIQDIYTFSPPLFRLLEYLKGFPASFSQSGFYGWSSVNNWALNRNLVQLFNICDVKTHPLPYLWESTGDSAQLKLIPEPVPIIALPHNIECFAGSIPPYQQRQQILTNLASEISCLQRASEIFAISTYDQWLLDNLGLPSQLLPYWPPSLIEDWCLGIAARRAQAQSVVNPRLPLILGTTNNPPTWQGISNLTKVLSSHLNSNTSFKANIAGYGTERLVGEVNPVHFNIYGSISNQELTDLLVDCHSVIVYQDYGSGSLTKIPELLLSGVPILSNFTAARGYVGCQGIHIYNSVSELVALIGSDLDHVFSPPQRSRWHEQAFVSCIESYL
ncbi:MAG: hypothetical protein WCJ92_07755 [Alphaproteobacteria bacterium]